MKKIYNILAAGVFALMTLNSCDEPYAAWDEEKGEGRLSTKDFVLNVVGEEGTRATTRDVNEFMVKISKITGKDTEEEKFSGKYGEMPGVITLPVGNYHIEAYNEEPVEADWEAPYYYKDTTITILRDKLESLGAVLCKLCNVKVTVKYDAKLRALLGDDAKVNVMMEDNPNKSLVYALEHADNETPGYFKYEEGSKTMVMTFTGTVKGTPVKAYDVKTEVNPGEHHIVTFSLKDTPGIPGESGYIGGSGMSINTTVTVVDLNNNVDPGNDPLDPYESITVSKNKLTVKAEGGDVDFTVSAKGSSSWFITGVPEWLTVTPTSGMTGTETAQTTTVKVTVQANTSNDSRTATINVRMARKTQTVTITQLGSGAPEPSEDLPTITSTNVDLDNILILELEDGEIKYDKEVSLDINTPLGLAHIYVEISSNTLTQAVLQGVGLDTEFDCVNPGNLEGGLKSLDLPAGKEIEGTKYQKFDITEFISLLGVSGASVNAFNLEVEDLAGNKTSASLRINVVGGEE